MLKNSSLDIYPGRFSQSGDCSYFMKIKKKKGVSQAMASKFRLLLEFYWMEWVVVAKI